MSKPPESNLDLEALELHFLPAWAREPAGQGRFARSDAPEGAAAGPRREARGGPGKKWDRGPRTSASGPFPRGGDRREHRPRGPTRESGRVEKPIVAAEVQVLLAPDPAGVESIARQIKLTGRAYPVFDIAHLILKRPDRYRVTFKTLKKPDGSVAQALWGTNLDDALWLSEADAVQHVLRIHRDTFYQSEKLPADPPKGTYTFVAQCGMSGVILGPPNLHEVQTAMRKLHAERFSHLPFEVYKSRVRIVKDEAAVKKWIEDQSWKTEYVCLNVAEARRLASLEEVESHFREVHLPNIVRQVETHTVSGTVAQQMACLPLRAAYRNAFEEQRRFPMRIVNSLSQQFSAEGLQFFKVNKTVIHVSVARPHFLDLEKTPVSDSLRRIVDFINATPGCTRRKLLDALAPEAAAKEASVEPEAPPGAGHEAGSPMATPPDSPAPAQPGQTVVVADLHWLIHEGHVIEFANGRMETARKPLPKPPPPAKPKVPPATGTTTDPAAQPQADSVVPPSTGQPVPVDGTDAAPVESSGADPKALEGIGETPEVAPESSRSGS